MESQIVYVLVLTLIVCEILGAVGMCILIIHEKPWRQVQPEGSFWHKPLGIFLSIFIMSTLWWSILGLAVLQRHHRTKHWFS
jgi:hypothetical protein